MLKTTVVCRVDTVTAHGDRSTTALRVLGADVIRVEADDEQAVKPPLTGTDRLLRLTMPSSPGRPGVERAAGDQEVGVVYSTRLSACGADAPKGRSVLTGPERLGGAEPTGRIRARGGHDVAYVEAPPPAWPEHTEGDPTLLERARDAGPR